MKPEELARVWIDQKLEESGWLIVNRDEYRPGMHGVAIRELILKDHHEADYILMVNGKAAAVLEAKRGEIRLDAPELIAQAEGYTKELLPWYRFWENPIKLIYLSNGHEIAFKDAHKIGSAYQKISSFPRPKDLVKLLRIKDPYAGLPVLNRGSLRACQFEAIVNFEQSLREGKRRALMVLATGAGKTFTACAIAYRALTYTSADRVLFLVDRNNLGAAALRAFGEFEAPGTGKKFSEIYGVEKLGRQDMDGSARVVISTIQRLYSVLSGQTEEIDEPTEDATEQPDDKSIPLPENPRLPKDFFDLIIIDECHRSIYSSWKAVLNYFDSAVLLGMTATPIPESLAFFDGNVVADYTLEQSIADGVNVPCRIYRIKTKITEEGGTIKAGEKVEVKANKTGEVWERTATQPQEFKKTEVNRSILVPDQIRKILQEYKDIVYTKLYPDREPNFDYLPKTLIFAASDNHAKKVVEIAKEVFERTDEQFVQRITYSAEDSNALIKSFRTDPAFRIAVTVTLVATGTDVKPLEVLIFLNDVRSETLYTQMKGRGVRTISNDQLRNATPNASKKDLFYLIDAVGVTESEKIVPGIGGDYEINPSLEALLERMSHGYVPDDYIDLLAGKLSAIGNRGEKEEVEEFRKLAGFWPQEFAGELYEALKRGNLPPFSDVNDENRERMHLLSPLLENIEARKKIVEIARGYFKTLNDTKDEIATSGFSQEEAQKSTDAFEQYVRNHHDEILALQLIHNGRAGELSSDDLQDLNRKLSEALLFFNVVRQWNDYALLRPKSVRKLSGGEETEALTNLIQLVRFAYGQIEELCSLPSLAAQRFELWCGQKQNELPLTPEQKELFRTVAKYIVVNGAYTFRSLRMLDPNLANQLVAFFGSAGAANDPILSLNAFMI